MSVGARQYPQERLLHRPQNKGQVQGGCSSETLCFVCFFSDRCNICRERDRWEIEVGVLLEGMEAGDWEEGGDVHLVLTFQKNKVYSVSLGTVCLNTISY